MTQTAPDAICVTGMHRSGTSFAAKALDALGVSFGDPDLLMQPGPDNPAGYWENRAIKELDNDLLAHLGGSWDSPPVLPPGWEVDPSIDEFRTRGSEILDATFGGRSAPGPVGWKDPRLSLLLPFWRTVATIRATVVLVRDPVEVARSLWKRDAIPVSQACLLWLRYLLAAIENDRENHVIVRYDQLLDDPARHLRTIASRLSLTEPSTTTVRAVTDHVDPSLRHHVASAEDNDENTDAIAALARRVWNQGDITLEPLGATTTAIAGGWLRPPVDTAAFDLVRARNVDLTELLRRRTRERARADDVTEVRLEDDVRR